MSNRYNESSPYQQRPQGGSSPSFSSSWTVIYIVLGVVTVIAIIALILGAYNTSKINKNNDNGQCSCYDRQSAINVWNAFNNAVVLLNTNPILSTYTLSNYFALTGIWSVPFQNQPIIGPQEIYNFFISYAMDPGEVNISLVDKSLTWDCLTRTLIGQRTWIATLTRARAFTPNSTDVLPINTTYQQDDLVKLIFNCNLTKGDGLHSIIYYREYYDNTQFTSTYTPPIATPCPSKYNCN